MRIEQREYQQLKAWFLDLACRSSVESLETAFRAVRFVPYAPVRQQLLVVWRAVNRERRLAGYEPLPIESVPWKRRIVRTFEAGDGADSVAASKPLSFAENSAARGREVRG